MDTPPPVQASPRRHHSQQRARMLAFLRATTTHPTAGQIHAALQPRMPALALATVYRNLEVLVAEGRVVEVPTISGALRYDGNLEVHDHFDCEVCGRLLDVPSCAPERLAKRLAERHGLRARRVQITFVGSCPDCAPRSAAAADPPRRSRAHRPDGPDRPRRPGRAVRKPDPRSRARAPRPPSHPH